MNGPTVDTAAAAAAVERSPATIRSWANRGYLNPVGVDTAGRTVYGLGDVYRVERERRVRK